LRVFTAIRHSLSPDKFYGGLWQDNFNSAFLSLGCEVVESKVDLLPTSYFMQVAHDFNSEERSLRGEITQMILDEVSRAHQHKPINLFLSYFYNAHFDPSGFEAIHKLDIPTVNFYCNSLYQFDLVSEIAPHVTYSWHAERDARTFYLEAGANPVWVQMGADPKLYRPFPTIVPGSKACFVGQRYADRDRWLASLLSQGIPVDIYGSGWPQSASSDQPAASKTASPAPTQYLGRQLYRPGSRASYLNLVQSNLQHQGLFHGTARTWRQLQYRRQSRQLDPILAGAYQGYANNLSQTFAHYGVVLNFSNVWADGRPGSSLIPHIRLRDFEAPMSRTCYLTGYTHEITEFYDLGTEIDTYRTVDELLDKTQFYLRHPAEAEKMREAGYQRARRDHTWTNRFQQLFEKIGLTSKPLVQ
jgi:hypothetical protein